MKFLKDFVLKKTKIIVALFVLFVLLIIGFALIISQIPADFSLALLLIFSSTLFFPFVLFLYLSSLFLRVQNDIEASVSRQKDERHSRVEISNIEDIRSIVAEEIILSEQRIVEQFLVSQKQQRTDENTSSFIGGGRKTEKSAGEIRAEIWFDYSAKGYGIGYDLLDIACIINNDGSADVYRTSTILAFSTIYSLDTYLLVPESATSDQDREVGFVGLESLSDDRKVLVTNRKKEAQKSAIEISFSPPLQDGEECRVRMIEKLPKGLFAINLSQDELDQRKTKYDYFAWNINRPTRHLRMQVFMQPEFTPERYSAEVRFASASGLPAEKIQYEEQKRIKNPTQSIQTGRYVYTLGVKNPMIGLIYMFSWQPKPRQTRKT